MLECNEVVGGKGVVRSAVEYYLGVIPCYRLAGDKAGCVSIQILHRDTLVPKRVKIVDTKMVSAQPMSMYHLLQLA